MGKRLLNYLLRVIIIHTGKCSLCSISRKLLFEADGNNYRKYHTMENRVVEPSPNEYICKTLLAREH